MPNFQENFMADARRLPKESDLDKLNKLLDWYEANKPLMARRCRTAMPTHQLSKFATYDDNAKEWDYRGWKLINTAP